MVEHVFPLSFGNCLGPFKLGQGIRETLDILFLEPFGPFETIYPDLDDALTGEIHIVLSEYGIRLRFQCISQTLCIIDVNLTQTSIVINGTIFGSKTRIVSTLDSVHKTLGVSFPGIFVEEDIYLLRFDGVTFFFTVPESLTRDKALEDIATFPSLPSSEKCYLMKVAVHPAILDMNCLSSFPDSMLVRAYVHLCPTGLKGGTSVSIVDIKETLYLGMNSQDILSILDNPDVVATTSNCNCRYEYKSIGMELFFNMDTHSLTRIVLHTNMPGVSDFARFSRCAFLVTYSSSDNTKASESEKLLWPDRITKVGEVLEAVALPTAPVAVVEPPSPLPNMQLAQPGRTKKNRSSDQLRSLHSLPPIESRPLPPPPTLKTPVGSAYITTTTPWTAAKETVGSWLVGSESVTAAIRAQPPGSPFQPTHYYGYPEVNTVFEVTEGGAIVSLTILDSK